MNVHRDDSIELGVLAVAAHDFDVLGIHAWHDLSLFAAELHADLLFLLGHSLTSGGVVADSGEGIGGRVETGVKRLDDFLNLRNDDGAAIGCFCVTSAKEPIVT